MSSPATTLVALWTPERILLGADSLVVTGGTVAYEGCKIVHTGDTWLAVSGLVSDSGTGYALAPLARVALDRAGTVEDKMQRFAAAVRGPLQAAMDTMRRESPSEYERLASGQPVLQAIFAVHENGRPVLATLGFIRGEGGTLETRASLVDGSDRRGPRLIYAGQQSRIREYLRGNSNWFGQNGEKLVPGLVQLEVDARSGLVGGPIDLVEVGAAGAHWLQKKSACE